MIRLLDGPCAGSYPVKRAPPFLRAVTTAGGDKDVLDQVDDEPAAQESVHVYQLQGEAGWVHLNTARRHGRGFYAIGDYRHRPDVDGEALRQTEAWRQWATEHAEEL